MRVARFCPHQGQPDVFNKGSLMNAGFVEILRRFPPVAAAAAAGVAAAATGSDERSMRRRGDGGGFDCYIFHDVDLLPEDDRNQYTCLTGTPRHVGAYVDKWKYL